MVSSDWANLAMVKQHESLEGEGDGELGALAGGAGNVDLAVVGFDELFGDGQAHPAADAVGVGAGAVAAPEAVEDVGEVFGGDAFASVGDDEVDEVGLAHGR